MEDENSKLINDSLAGNSIALEKLIKKNQDYIYNVCRSMFLNPMDAEDITQEILIKIVTNLSKYDSNKSKFTTWVYKITMNHVINIKKQKLEELTHDFEQYGKELDQIPFTEIQKEELARPETKLLIEEAKLGCSMGMLLCLDRNQRAAFVLGEIMRVPHKVAAEILEISPDNYRQRLSRARKDLFNFMENKCGLVNKNNPCRCERKTTGFMKAGWVDKNNLKFAFEHIQRVKEVVEKQECIEDEFSLYDSVYDENPFYKTPKALLEKILNQLEPEFIKK